MRKSRPPVPAPSPVPVPGKAGPGTAMSEPDAALAAFIRRVVTRLGVHRACDLAVCRRAQACAGRHLPCYAARREELRPILRSILAHNFVAAEAAGETAEAGPAERDGHHRVVAAERATAARIAAGTEPADATAYGLWVRNVVTPHLARKGDLAPHQDDGSRYDPDAKLRE